MQIRIVAVLTQLSSEVRAARSMRARCQPAQESIFSIFSIPIPIPTPTPIHFSLSVPSVASVAFSLCGLSPLWPSPSVAIATALNE